MRELHSLALKSDGRCLWILDQTRLPFEEVWLDGGQPRVMTEHIQRLAVRGAPLIGVAAALALARFAEDGASRHTLREGLAMLRKARPTAVNLMNAMDRMRAVLDADGGVTELVREAEVIFDEDVHLCEAMAQHGLGLLGSGEGVLTHCNAGALATVGIGTALGLVRRGWEAGKIAHVFVDETRPLLQGARLTVWELARLGVPHTLITDSMAPVLMAQSKVQRVLVGADRIARNGDFANKIGTYGVAVQASHHGIPFHAVAPWTTVDLSCATGSQIPIEEREASELHGWHGLRWALPETPVFNPAFDVTPAQLVTSLVLDRGVASRAALLEGGLPAMRPSSGTSPGDR